jgi:2-oxoglutarate dehydrogenase E2 component (dihydrolipoamide succinyltransferase)
MAIVEVKVPQLSESVAEATMLQWKKKVGDSVTADEILIDIETDKVVLEVPAPASGVLSEILVVDGGTVAAEQLIARIDTDGKVGAASTSASPAASPVSAPVSVAPALAAASTLAAPASNSHAGVAMPAASKIMADNQMAAGSVAGTGKDGRVTKGDVLAAVAGGVQSTAAVIPTGVPTKTLPQVSGPAVNLGDRPEQRVPMTRLRARVAERLLQSQSTNAILTTFNEINMAPVMDMRKRMQERFEKEHGCKLGFMSFFVKAAVHALKKFPVLNASVDGNDIVYHGYFDIGIAVG